MLEGVFCSQIIAAELDALFKIGVFIGMDVIEWVFFLSKGD